MMMNIALDGLHRVKCHALPESHLKIIALNILLRFPHIHCLHFAYLITIVVIGIEVDPIIFFIME